jgi:predicted lipoprotein
MPPIVKLLRTVINFFIVIFIGIFFSSTAHSNQEKSSWETNHLTLVQQHIVPSYHALLSHSTQLQNAIALHCENLSAGVHNDQQQVPIKQIFKNLYIHWAKVQPINFGPITYLKRQVRMQYWPDKHNVGGKQLARLLRNNSAITLKNLQKKSVAVQGLPALEKIIYAKDSITSINCSLAHRISKNIESIAQETYDGWTQLPALFMNDFLPENYDYGTYSSTKEITAILAKSMTHYLELIEKEKLKALANNNNIKPNHRKLEAWRSGVSAQLIYANIQTIEQIYLSVFSTPIMLKNNTLDQKIKNEFITLTKKISILNTSLYEEIQAEQKNIMHWRENIQQLQKLAHQALTKELGLTFTFNSLDGD